MSKICIGIISYIPQKWSVRQERITRFLCLIGQLEELFKLPIIVIAQNYKQEDKNKIGLYYPDANITYIDSVPLGITGARERLRQEFLKTDYTDIILLDDDCQVKGDKATADCYLAQIEKNSGKLGIFARSLHKLMSLGKEAATLLKYDLENTPEKYLMYEDRKACWTFVGKYPDKFYRFEFYEKGPHNLNEMSVANHDHDSSWSRGITSKIMGEMIHRTEEAVEAATGKKIADIYKLAGYDYKTVKVDSNKLTKKYPR